MFCPKCGNELPDDAGFCGKCGASLGKSKEATAPVNTAGGAGTGAAQSATAGKTPLRIPKAAIIGVVALIVVIIAVFAVVLPMTGAYTLGQTSGTFRKAFEETGYVTDGVASNDYVNESPYHVVEFNVENIEKVSDERVRADVFAVVENESFKTSYNLTAEYAPNASKLSSGTHGSDPYDFTLIYAETVPLKGIDKDKQRGLEGVSAELSEDGTSCEASVTKKFSYWFADVSIDAVYRYAFNGQKWSYESKDENVTAAYKDIDGAYAAKAGDLTHLSAFQISGFNAETGEFSIDCNINSYDASGFLLTNHYAETTCSLTATIEAKQGGTRPLSDGFTYEFKATGTSSRGDKTAEMRGYFAVRDDGAPAIEITGMSISTEYTMGSGSTPTKSQMTSTGTLFKQ